MTPDEYKHTWVIPRSAWYIRFYTWLWWASVEDITFCKLFWAYTLILIGVFLRILYVIALPILIVQRKTKARRCRRCRHGIYPGHCHICSLEMDKQNREAVAKFMQTIPMRVLVTIAHGFAWLIMRFKSLVTRPKVVFSLLGVTAVAVLVGLGFGSYQLWLHTTMKEFLSFLLDSSLFIGAILGIVGLALGLVFIMISKNEGGLGLGPKLCETIFIPLGLKSKSGGLKFKDVMRIGYVSVKSNTCPRVVVDKEGD